MVRRRRVERHGRFDDGGVTNDELQRDYDSNGTPLLMATRVVANSISFTLCGNTLRLNVDVLGDRNNTDSLDLITYVRKLS